jgi:DNA-binding MarR family transcriptional regulator
MNYPAYQEVLRKIQPELDRMRRESIVAEYADSSTPAIRYREIVGEKGAMKCRPAEQYQLHADHFLFVNDIVKFESDGLKQRYDRLNWGIGRGNRILRQLEALGYVAVKEQRSANPNGGRSRLVPGLTDEGREFLKSYEARK